MVQAYPDPNTEQMSRVPGWAATLPANSPEDAAFSSGAALVHLHHMLVRRDVPHDLLRARLALRAAEAGLILSGRSARTSDLRDMIHFLQPGDRPGPAGEIYLSWRRAVERPVSGHAIERAVPDMPADRIAAGFRDRENSAPVSRAASALERIMSDDPTAETAALILADAVLSGSLGWSFVIPLLGIGMGAGGLDMRGADLRVACHRAVASAAITASREAAELTRRVARLHEVAPKLRARGADGAVAMFLTRDAVTPGALTSLRSPRSARRFCDRMVELGAARELTGRDTFRLYGV